MQITEDRSRLVDGWCKGKNMLTFQKEQEGQGGSRHSRAEKGREDRKSIQGTVTIVMTLDFILSETETS